MRKQIMQLALALLLIAPLEAEIRFDLSDFETAGTKGDFGLINVNDINFIKTGISPDFKFKGLELGLDLNLYFPTESGVDTPQDFQAVALRHVGFNYKNRQGFRWGHLKNVTFGYGLLMDNYNSASGGNGTFTTEKAGFLGYASFRRLRADALYTGTNVKGGRLSYTIPASPLMGSPIIFGATFISDSDGINDDTTGKLITRPVQDAYAFDIGLPIAGNFLTAYAEYAQLVDQGAGGTAGIKGDVFNIVDYRAEYRVLGANFVPGYFNQSYEATSFDFSTVGSVQNERISGFLVGVNANLFKGYAKAGLQYEKYDEKDLLTFGLGWQKVANTVGVINYYVPFQGDANAIGELQALYTTGGLMDYLISVRRVYVNSNDYTETYKVGVRFNLGKVLPQSNWLK